MKKLMIACAAALAGLTAAQAAPVHSSNTVGFHTINLAGGGNYTMIGINWNKVGGTSLKINELWDDPAAAGLYGDADFGLADQIQVWQIGGGYKTYYLYDTGAGTEWDNKWYEVGNDSYPTEDTLTPGCGAWYLGHSSNTLPVTLKGEVPASAIGLSVVNGYAMLANIYPAPIAINGFDWATQGAYGNADFGLADQIQVWQSGGGYKTYYFYDSGAGTEWDNKWYEVGNDNYPTEDTIPAGSGFWYLGHSTWTLTLPAPAAN